MRAVLLASLASLSLRASAHPAPGSAGKHLSRRTVDLNSFRITQDAAYSNKDSTSSNNAVAGLVRRADDVDTATQLVKAVAPGVEFRVVDDHYVGTNGIAHVNFKQTVHGIDIDNADFNVNIKDGKVFSYGNSFFKGELPASNPLVKRDFKDPIEALKSVTKSLQLGVAADAAKAQAKEKETYVFDGTSGAVKKPEAKLVYFVKPDGSLSLTWRVETDIYSNWLLSYVDANTPETVHGVVDWSQDATYQVYPWGLNDPTEGSRQSLTDPWDTTASPFTWNGDGTTNYPTTRGNNGIAQSNPSGGSAYLNNYRPNSTTLNFSYPYSATMTPPSSYIDASITQLFYTANTYHDLLYLLGFTEKAGNFQVNNNGKGGTGNDFVILNAQDGSGTNNANFATPPDGQPGRMRMYTWTTATPNRDGSLEAGIVIHEYTHGLSNRLTGGPANSNCLNALEAGGMGEGWGDFMATAIRLKPSDTASKDYVMGAWAANDPEGIRAYPYSTSLTTNPYTYTSVNSLTAVHAIGTVWATMLYEVLWALIAKHGKNDAAKPTFTNGVPTDGKYLTMKLVVDGMALQPCNPNFVQARDAIIDADENLTGGANKCALWTAFAKRGLGDGAAYGANKNRVASTKIPAGAC